MIIKYSLDLKKSWPKLKPGMCICNLSLPRHSRIRVRRKLGSVRIIRRAS
jgi:hypothetical protein